MSVLEGIGSVCCPSRQLWFSLGTQIPSCSSVKSQQNRWLVAILGWEQSGGRGYISLQEQSSTSTFFTAAAGVKPSALEFCLHMWVTLSSFLGCQDPIYLLRSPRTAQCQQCWFSKNSAHLYTYCSDDIFVVFPIASTSYYLSTKQYKD